MRDGVRRRLQGSFVAALFFASTAQAGSGDVRIEPTPLLSGGPLRARIIGPLTQPAPELELRVETGRIVLRAYVVDFVDPQLPALDFVEVVGTAPAAGSYLLVLETCGGNPPPPNPVCEVTPLETLQVLPVAGVPAASTWMRVLLSLALVVTALRLVRRGRTLSASSAP